MKAVSDDSGAGSIEFVGDLTASEDSLVMTDGQVKIVGNSAFSGGIELDTDGSGTFTIGTNVEFVLDGEIVSTKDIFKMEPGSWYNGPVITTEDQTGSIQKIELDVGYTDGSVLRYNGNDYTVFSRSVGTVGTDEMFIRFMVSGVKIEFQGEPIEFQDISGKGPMAYTLTGHEGDDSLITTIGCTGFQIDQDFIKKNGQIVEPGKYVKALDTTISWTYIVGHMGATQVPQNGVLHVWVDIDVTKIDISKYKDSGLEITADDVTYTGKDLSKDVKFTIPGKHGKVLDQSSCEIVYSADASTRSPGTVNADGTFSDVGSYLATVTVDKDNQYFTGTYEGIMFKVVPAKADITLSPSDEENNITVSWPAEQYKNGTVKVAIQFGGKDLTGDDLGTVTIERSYSLTSDGKLNKTGEGYRTDDNSDPGTEPQALLDRVLWSYRAPTGMTFYIQVSTAESASGNIAASESAVYKVVVEPFVPIEDYVEFTLVDPDDGVTLDRDENDRFSYTLNGIIKQNDEGRYYIEITAESTIPDKIKIHTEDLTGATPNGMTEVTCDSKDVDVSETETQTDNEITIKIYIDGELSIDEKVTVSVKSTRHDLAKDATYTIDLSGLAPEMFCIKLVEENYATLVFKNYTEEDNGARYPIKSNGMGGLQGYEQVTSYGDGLVYFTNGSMFPLPATASNSLWKLASSGVTYQAGSVYTVAAKDIKGGAITFNAVGSSGQQDQPDEEQSYVITAVGYESGDAGKTIEAAVAAHGRTVSVTDAQYDIMFVVFTIAQPGNTEVSLTVDGATKVLYTLVCNKADAVGYVYWNMESEGYTYTIGSTYTITVTSVEDRNISASASFVASAGSEIPEPEYTVFYVIGTDVTSETVTADKALTFPTVQDKTVDWYLNGQKIESTEDVKVTEDTTFVGEVQAATEYGSHLKVNVELIDGKIWFNISDMMGMAVQPGRITVHYSVLDEDGFPETFDIQVTDDVIYNGGLVTGSVGVPNGVNLYAFSADFTNGTTSVSSLTAYVGA